MNKPLTDDLLGLVPQRPDPSGWGPRVRRTKARRRVAGGVAATAILVSIAVTLPAALNGRNPLIATPYLTNSPQPTSTTTDPAPPPTTAEVPPEDDPLIPRMCSDLFASELTFSRPSKDGLAEGATRVWLCGDPGSAIAIAGPGPIGPHEALATDPDRVIRAYNALERGDSSQGCPMDAGLNYNVVIDYPDGNVAFPGETRGCGMVGDRADAQGFLREITAMWREQREATPPAYTGMSDVCGDQLGGRESFFETVRREDIERGVLCAIRMTNDDGGEPRPEWSGEAWLPDELIADLKTATLEPPPGPAADPPLYPHYLMMLNAAGDPVVYHVGMEGRVYVRDPDNAEFLGIWRPSGEALQQWHATLEAAGIIPE